MNWKSNKRGWSMKIVELTERPADLLEDLTAVWEASVRATHLFLPEKEIARLRTYVPQALAEVENLAAAHREDGSWAGFLGAEKGRLEMLFLSPEERGTGLGRRLLQYGMDRYAVRSLTVNEQNPDALGFYQHMGFQVVCRTPLDEQGAPYPLLYLKLIQ